MKKPALIALFGLSAFLVGVATPRPGAAAGNTCTDDCVADRDYCMSQVGQPGAPRAFQCLAEYRACLARCN